MVEALVGEDAYDVYAKRLCRSNYNDLDKGVRKVIRLRKNVARLREILNTKGQKHYHNSVLLQVAKKDLETALADVKPKMMEVV